MPRQLSSAALRAQHAEETGEVWVLLLEIAHPGLAEPIRVCNDAVDLVSDGHTYVAWPFEIALPEDTDERVPQVQLTIDNISREIVEAVRSLSSPPVVSLSVVLASSPDHLEYGPMRLEFMSVEYDALTVTATLGLEPVLSEPIPGDTMTPGLFPGLF